MDNVWKELIGTWPSSIIARKEVGKFSGGLINPLTIRNLDSLGQGPKNRLKIGRRTAYRVRDLVEWLRGRQKE